MVIYTRNNGYAIAEKNERNWHEPYHETLARIDADIAGISGSSISKDRISAAQYMHLPVYADLSNYPNPSDGTVAYASGAGVVNEGMYVYDGVSWIGPFGSGDGGSGETNTLWTDLDDVETGTLANRPAAGTAGQWYFTNDGNGGYYDNGNQWIKTFVSPGDIAQSDLSFDPITSSELSTHSDSSGAHHTRYSDSEAQSAVSQSVDAANLSGDSGVAGQVLHTDGNEAFWDSSDGSGGTTIDSGTFLMETSSMSTSTTIENVTTDEQVQASVGVGPDTVDQVNETYSFNYDYSQTWDNTNGWMNIDLVVNWDTNPGSDMSFSYQVKV